MSATKPWRSEIKEKGSTLYWDCKEASVAHQRASQRWNNIAISLGLLITMFSAFAGATLFSESATFALIAGIMTLIVSVASAANTFLKPGELKVSHETAHKLYLELSNEAVYFWNTESSRTFPSVPEAQDVLGKLYEILIDRKSELEVNSPMVPIWAEKLAKKEIWNDAKGDW